MKHSSSSKKIPYICYSECDKACLGDFHLLFCTILHSLGSSMSTVTYSQDIKTEAVRLSEEDVKVYEVLFSPLVVHYSSIHFSGTLGEGTM